MSDEADIASDLQQMANDLAVRKALEEASKKVQAEPDECLHCEENPRPMILGATGHPHRAANCVRCMDELGMQYTLAEPA